MQFTRFFLSLLMLLAVAALPAQAFELVTPEQVMAEARATDQAAATPPPAKPMTRSLSLGPRIKVLAPSLGGEALRGPLRIELQFEPVGEAKVNPASLKVLYGFLGIDLTDKIRGNAAVSEKGVLAEKASLPAGSHRLRVQVADSLGRVGETELRFKVEN